jgi:hypothetical protein
MKKILIVLVLVSLTLALTGCARHTAAECQTNWLAGYTWGTPEDTIFSIMNHEWPPESIGGILKECLEDGWTPN